MIYCRWFSCLSMLLLCTTAGLLFWADGNVGRHERLLAPTQRSELYFIAMLINQGHFGSLVGFY